MRVHTIPYNFDAHLTDVWQRFGDQNLSHALQMQHEVHCVRATCAGAQQGTKWADYK